MQDDEKDEDQVTCWCGAKGTAEELFSELYLESRCGGSGVVNCFCGGDFCVCHNHGESECLGCPDCEEEDDDYYDEEP